MTSFDPLRRRPAIALAVLLVAIVPILACSKSRMDTVDWDVTRPIVDADQTIPIAIFRGTCDTFDQAKVEETADQVTIRAIVRHPNRPCDKVGIFENVEVQLAAPMGTRQLVGCLPQHDCRTPTGPVNGQTTP